MFRIIVITYLLWYGLSGKYIVKSLDCVFTFNSTKNQQPITNNPQPITNNPQPTTTLNEVSEVLFISESKHGGIAFRVAVGSDM